jgi:acetyl-CoA acyltransferase
MTELPVREAVIVEAVRTPAGRRGGSLSGWHPAELAAVTLRALAARTQIDPALVEDVIMGCVTQAGPQSTNVARTAVLAAGFPQTVPGTTIDRQCGSSQQALEFAARAVVAGAYDIVIAAGVECMSSVPMFSNAGGDVLSVYGNAVGQRYSDRDTFGHKGLVPQGLSAEAVAKTWNLTRESLDTYGLRSQEHAICARDQGRFGREIIPVEVRRRDKDTGEIERDDALLASDECIRPTSMQALAQLKPAFMADGVVTAGNASQIVDGAAALLVMERRVADKLGLRARAALRHGVVIGSDTVLMLDGPIAATRKVLERAALRVEDIDLFEVNEAFAAVVLAWQAEIGADMSRVNVNGGGISLGHPLGASGAKLMVTLLHELERTSGRWGLQTMCEGGGMANATIVERLG